MSRVMTISAPAHRANGRLTRLARILLPIVLVTFAGLFMAGILANVERIVGGNSGLLNVDFFVLFIAGALYAAGLLFIWYYSALMLTSQWLDRLVKRLEAETEKPNNV
ncbi:MAG: hypothetical protein AB1510_02460 [Bacillota bacterium]